MAPAACSASVLTLRKPHTWRHVFWLAVLIIAIALVFDYINGFHDAANSIATIVATRVLTPFQAVLWAAFFNFAAAFLFSTKVAKTVGTGVVNFSEVTQYVIMAARRGIGNMPPIPRGEVGDADLQQLADYLAAGPHGAAK